MNAEIITIGDEILIGQIVDTNSAWLGKQLNNLGVTVDRITSISDDKKEIMTTIDNALKNSRITFVTGGLGPTKDDITKVSIAELFGCELVKDQKSYDAIEALCARIGLEFNELNISQSYVPSCANAIVNDNGTAPAMVIERDGNMLISLPGVPFEMKPLCEDKIFPLIKKQFALKHNIHISVNVYGIPESALAIKLEEWESGLPKHLHLAYLPSPQRVRLRLSAYQVENKESIEREIDEQFSKLNKIIPKNLLGTESDTLEALVHNMLLERGETLSVAESCTGGAIASTFTQMSGASGYFLGGVVAYSNEVKNRVLGVDNELLIQYGAVSEPVVRQMAQGVKDLTGSTYAIATSGVAGPSGGTDDKPVGTVWIAIATPNGVFAQKRVFTKLRAQNIEYATARAVSILRDYLIEN